MSDNLAKTELDFRDWVIAGKTDIHPTIVDSKQVSRDLRLDIYREGYSLRLIEVLENDFPVTKVLCGDDFETLARDYIDAHPSTSFSVQNFGKNFSGFFRNRSLNGLNNAALRTALYSDWIPEQVRDDMGCETQSLLPAEMAAFEWAMETAFLAPDQTILTVEDLQHLTETTWPEVVFHFTDSVQCLAHYHHIGELWLAVDSEAALPDVTRSETLQQTLIWRQGFDAHFAVLSDKEVALYECLCAKQSFAELCESMAEHLSESDVVPFVASRIQAWLAERMFVKSQ